MAKKVLSFIIVLSMVLGALPAYVKAEITAGVPTLILTETLVLAEEAAGNENEGWQWMPDEAGGGTLILENCYIQSQLVESVFNFNNITKESSKINIILRGHNILEVKEKKSGPLVSSNEIAKPFSYTDYIVSEDGEGSLDIIYEFPSDILYMFPGRSVTIKSGDISTNSGLCIIMQDFSMLGGSLEINVPEEIPDMDGIYTINGPVNISGGTVDINVSRCGIWVAGDPAQNNGDQTVNISGGDINIKSGYTSIHIGARDLPGEDTQTLNITGGNVTCSGEMLALYAKNVNIIKGDGVTTPVVNVSKGENSQYPSIMPSTKKITVSGSIVIADGILGYESGGGDSLLESSIIFNSGNGKVYNDVEITDNFTVPDGATLSVPDGATLSVPEDIVLSVPDSASLQVSNQGQIINNGTVILPENNDITGFTGTGIIKKGGNFYTNDNEQVYPVTIKQKENEYIKYYKEGEIVTLVPESNTEYIRFKEWKTTSPTLVITDNKFEMPAESVTVEAVFEQFYKVTIKQPGGIVTEYYKEGENVTLVPETAEDRQFKEWKVTPETLVIINNQFIMPAGEVIAEPVYEEIPSVTDSPVIEETPVPPAVETPSPGPGETPVPPLVGTPSPSPGVTQKPVSINPYPYIPVNKIITTVLVASPSGGGKVSGKTEAIEGETITVKAVANDGYVFTEWQEDGKTASTDAEYKFKAEKNRTLTAVFKKDMPENGIQNTIHVANNIKTISLIPLPAGWEWSRQDSTKTIMAGGSVTAAAVYAAGDAKDYINAELKVTVIRDVCEENQTILYTSEGEYAPGCTTEGLGHTECRICGDIVRDGIKVPADGHTEGAPVIAKATINKDGSITSKCIKCDTALKSTIINKINTIELSPGYGIYNDKTQHPSVLVKDSKGNMLEQGTDYMVSWAKGMKKAGIYNVKISFKGRYDGTAVQSYKILPGGTVISSAKAKKKGFVLKWKKQGKQTSGYQIQYSLNKKFKKKNTKKVIVKNNKIISISVKNIKANKKYYVRIRTYKAVKTGKKIVKVFSGWSKTKTVKTK
ncbi:MAG: hypothetical protein HFH68_03165 [Lachnospiraceae bacterium]|nr:hypothetical protein [Lachnospiraceae bacterium]